nr:hypothetical protein [Cerasicoccus maritimus]
MLFAQALAYAFQVFPVGSEIADADAGSSVYFDALGIITGLEDQIVVVAEAGSYGDSLDLVVVTAYIAEGVLVGL